MWHVNVLMGDGGWELLPGPTGGCDVAVWSTQLELGTHEQEWGGVGEGGSSSGDDMAGDMQP